MSEKVFHLVIVGVGLLILYFAYKSANPSVTNVRSM